ncbi:bis(5'-adenosyl)-triphosphatase [Trichomonascus vanleenenianus]|uniref:bis(5'-adenosyl)-triphosphatase n=1 Tax=Trichomonascus vanleenenianus TaxID=2268995 RepID=UPI003ECB5E9D
MSLIKFGPFTVTNQVFLRTAHSYGLVNLKPLLPGHVLVCPYRGVPRVSMLTDEEAADFYAAVQRVSKIIEQYYRADALNISIQDGPLAGQSVPHVHCHIIPRRLGDLENADEVYHLLDSKGGDLDYVFRTLKHHRNLKVLGVDNEERAPRQEEDMVDEVRRLSNYIEENHL